MSFHIYIYIANPTKPTVWTKSQGMDHTLSQPIATIVLESHLQLQTTVIFEKFNKNIPNFDLLNLSHFLSKLSKPYVIGKLRVS